MTDVSFAPSGDASIAGLPVRIFCPALGECENASSDEELVEKSLCGEEDAFRRLYERYRRLIYLAVCRITLDAEEARDATQEIFITVYRSLALYNPSRGRFSSWIYRVANNRAIDYWRTRRRRAEMPLMETLSPKSNGTPFCTTGARTMERILEQKERAAEVRRFLDELPRHQRRFFILRYYEGLKLREIAEKEGYRLGTVKSSLHKATRAVRSKLKKFGVRS